MWVISLFRTAPLATTSYLPWNISDYPPSCNDRQGYTYINDKTGLHLYQRQTGLHLYQWQTGLHLYQWQAGFTIYNFQSWYKITLLEPLWFRYPLNITWSFDLFMFMSIIKLSPELCRIYYPKWYIISLHYIRWWISWSQTLCFPPWNFPSFLASVSWQNDYQKRYVSSYSGLIF